MNYCTIGIFAHANAGKTTVTENILFNSGVISEIGRVDTGTTVTDNMNLERERGITIKSSYVTFQEGDFVYQLLDTPGHVDFSAEVVRAMSVLDVAVFVISGVEGIEAQTVTIWNMLKKMKIPTVFYINKLDRDGADYQEVIRRIKKYLTSDLVELENVVIDNKRVTVSLKKDEDLIEQIAEIDDEVLKLFLDGSQIDSDWMNNRIKTLVGDRKLFFVVAGSALMKLGVKELLDSIIKYYSFETKQMEEMFCGKVYMVKRKDGVKESYVKVLNGKINNRDNVWVNGEEQKIKSLQKMVGSTKFNCETAQKGQLIIVTGIDCTSGDYVCADQNQIIMKHEEISVSPMFTTSITAVNSLEENKLWLAVNELNDEDPYLNCRLDDFSKKIQIDLMGKLQGETIKQIISERFSIETELNPPSIIYKETPLCAANGKAGYTKTSNVAFRIEPLERGSGFVFESALDTDYLFAKYQKQCERLVKKYSQCALHGWNLTDCKVILIGGKCDNVGSEPKDYNIAAPIAFARAIKAAGTRLLEPIVKYELYVSKEYYQDIMSQVMRLNRGYEEIIEKKQGFYIIGQAFISEMESLANQLRESSGGMGRLNYFFSGYDDALFQNDEAHNDTLDYGDTPFNEELFVMTQFGIMEKLDFGLETKRGKPEKIKRNKRFWS